MATTVQLQMPCPSESGRAAAPLDTSRYDDLVVWSPGRERVEALAEARMAAALRAASADLLTAAYMEIRSGHVSLLDLAVRFGHEELAAQLAHRGVPRYHTFVFGDFVEAADPAAAVNALSFHFKWVLAVPAVNAARRAGVSFLGMLASHSTHAILRHPFSLLDAAVLGGCREQATALAEHGVGTALGHKIAPYLLIESPSGSFWLDSRAIAVALASGMEAGSMYIDIQQIDFSYPMKKETRPFLLLDVAICLGQRDVAVVLARHGARLLAVQGTTQSALAEAHLACRQVLFPMLFWKPERKGSFPRENVRERTRAAAAVADVLDRTRSEAYLEYVVLLLQWHQQCAPHCRGCVQKWEPGLLSNIFRYMLPRQPLRFPLLDRWRARN